MSETLKDKDRKNIVFNRPQVEGVIPHHFLEQYPNFVSLLKKFYAYIEESGETNNIDLKNSLYTKDRESTKDAFLDYLFHETINGLGASKFDHPRLTLKLVPSFYPIKGTEVSVSAFFRYIYGVDVTQFYPKSRMFIVGESEIGAESLRFIQDSFFYQILSIQIKSPLGISEWRDIYKRFNHPAGFALFAETLFEATGNNSTVSAETDVTTDTTSPSLHMVFDDEASSFTA